MLQCFLTDLLSSHWPPRFIFFKCRFKINYLSSHSKSFKSFPDYLIRQKLQSFEGKTHYHLTAINNLNSFNLPIPKPARLVDSFIHSFIHSYTHSFIKHGLTASYVPITMLGGRDLCIKRQSLTSMQLLSSGLAERKGPISV